MKKLFIGLLFLINGTIAFAQQTEVYNGSAWVISGMPSQRLCNIISFRAIYSMLSEDFEVMSRAWYLDGVLQTTVTDPTVVGVDLRMTNKGNHPVYCQIRVRKKTGAQVVYTTNVVTITVRVMAFAFSPVTNPSYGCTNPITLTSNTISNSEEDAASAPYNVAWSVPAGWTVSPVGVSGLQASIIPASFSGGTVTATLTNSCGATVQQSVTLTRPMPEAPQFVDFQGSVCAAGTVRYNVSPVCGASYTFTSSNSLITFPNGLTTWTSADPYCDISYNGSSRLVADLTVKADFSSGVSTATISRSITFGLPTQPGGVNITYPGGVYRVRAGLIVPVSGATRYNWYVNGESWGFSTNTWRDFLLESCGMTYTVEVEAVNACGISERRSMQFVMNCPGMFAVSPNPVNSTLRIVMAGDDAVKARTASEDIIFSLYNVNGTALLKTWKVKSGKREYQFEVGSIPKGQYVLQAISRDGKVSKQVVIQ